MRVTRLGHLAGDDATDPHPAADQQVIDNRR